MRDQPEGPDSRDFKAIQTFASSHVFKKVRDEPVTRATEDTKRTTLLSGDIPRLKLLTWWV